MGAIQTEMNMLSTQLALISDTLRSNLQAAKEGKAPASLQEHLKPLNIRPRKSTDSIHDFLEEHN